MVSPPPVSAHLSVYTKLLKMVRQPVTSLICTSIFYETYRPFLHLGLSWSSWVVFLSYIAFFSHPLCLHSQALPWGTREIGPTASYLCDLGRVSLLCCPPVFWFYGKDNHHNSFKGNVGDIVNNFLSVDLYCEPSRSQKEQGTLEEEQSSNSNSDSWCFLCVLDTSPVLRTWLIAGSVVVPVVTATSVVEAGGFWVPGQLGHQSQFRARHATQWDPVSFLLPIIVKSLTYGISFGCHKNSMRVQREIKARKFLASPLYQK